MMTTPCVDALTVPKEGFLHLPPYSPRNWLSPVSFVDESPGHSSRENEDTNGPDKDFEFRLDDPVAMLPADELFSDGKLIPLQMSRPRLSASVSSPVHILEPAEVEKPSRRSEIGVSELCALSPKAPRCSSGWRELLRLKRSQNAKNPVDVGPTKTLTTTATMKAPKSLKQLLRGGSDSKTCGGVSSSPSFPLLRSAASEGDSETESASISLSSSRFSVSSSSFSCSDHDEPHRFSLDLEKTSYNLNPRKGNTGSYLLNRPLPRLRVADNSNGNVTVNGSGRIGRCLVRQTLESGTIPPRGASLDSPRMNSSGKIVFQSLGRSSSSPSTFSGGFRNWKDAYYRHRDVWWGMERSYSASIRVTPVLNVPVCTLRASGSKGTLFGLLSAQKKEPARSSRCRRNRVDARI